MISFSSVTVTVAARGSVSSIKVVMPSLQQCSGIFRVVSETVSLKLAFASIRIHLPKCQTVP